jgi:hypothetical protein
LPRSASFVEAVYFDYAFLNKFVKFGSGYVDFLQSILVCALEPFGDRFVRREKCTFARVLSGLESTSGFSGKVCTTCLRSLP